MKITSEMMLFQSKPTSDTASGDGVTVLFGVDPPSKNDMNDGLQVRSTPECTLGSTPILTIIVHSPANKTKGMQFFMQTRHRDHCSSCEQFSEKKTAKPYRKKSTKPGKKIESKQHLSISHFKLCSMDMGMTKTHFNVTHHIMHLWA